MVYYSPKVDLVFRKLFGDDENKDLLISLINSIVGPRIVITDLMIKNPYNLADYADGRMSILDIKAVDQNGKLYDIEMQIAPQVHYGRRALYYLSKVYVDQIAEGDSFDDLRETIGIHFLDFDYFQDDRYVREVVYRDADTGEYYDQLGHQRLYFIEMRKFRKGWNELSTALDRWISFLNRAESLSRLSIPQELAVDRALVKAVEQLERIGFDPEEREIYERKVQTKMIDAATLQHERNITKEHMLLRQISKRFGPASDDLPLRLHRLESEQLDELAEAIFDLNSRSEIDAWLTSRLKA